MSGPFRHDISGCLAWRIGDSGLSETDLADMVEKARPAVTRLRQQYREGALPLLKLPDARDDLPLLQRIAQRYRRFDTAIVLGIGGSSLGGQALCALAPGGAGRPPSDGVSVVFLENIDPQPFARWIDHAEQRATGFIVVSKSGNTAETLAQFLVAWERLSAAAGPEKAADYFTVVTEPTDNPLRRMARRHGMRLVDHDPELGGRYSVLSGVGLLPAMIAGLDGGAVRAGAAEVLRQVLEAPNPVDSSPALGAALQLAAAQRQRSISVMLPYGETLRPFALWYCQLWAESLGKSGHGTTPVAAQGPVDQHSQLQLWLDGPRDKFFTIVTADRARTGPGLAGAADDHALAYLTGRSMGDLLDAEQRATAETLMNHRCPVRQIRLPQIDERAIGALFMHFMLETILAGYMLGVNPFDQPAVEQGKALARKFLSDMGRAPLR